MVTAVAEVIAPNILTPAPDPPDGVTIAQLLVVFLGDAEMKGVVVKPAGNIIVLVVSDLNTPPTACVQVWLTLPIIVQIISPVWNFMASPLLVETVLNPMGC